MHLLLLLLLHRHFERQLSSIWGFFQNHSRGKEFLKSTCTRERTTKFNFNTPDDDDSIILHTVHTVNAEESESTHAAFHAVPQYLWIVGLRGAHESLQR